MSNQGQGSLDPCLTSDIQIKLVLPKDRITICTQVLSVRSLEQGSNDASELNLTYLTTRSKDYVH